MFVLPTHKPAKITRAWVARILAGEKPTIKRPRSRAQYRKLCPGCDEWFYSRYVKQKCCSASCGNSARGKAGNGKNYNPSFAYWR